MNAPAPAIALARAASAAAAEVSVAAVVAAGIVVVVKALAGTEAALTDGVVLRLVAATGVRFSPRVVPSGTTHSVVLRRAHAGWAAFIDAFALAYPELMGEITNADRTETHVTRLLIERWSTMQDNSSLFLALPDHPAPPLVRNAQQTAYHNLVAAALAAAPAMHPLIFPVDAIKLPLFLGLLFAWAGIKWLAGGVYTYSGLVIHLTAGVGRGPPWMPNLALFMSWFRAVFSHGESSCVPPYAVTALDQMPRLLNGGGARGSTVATQLIDQCSHHWMTVFHGRHRELPFVLELRPAVLAAGGSAAGRAAAALTRLALVAARGGQPNGIATRVTALQHGPLRCTFYVHGVLPAMCVTRGGRYCSGAHARAFLPHNAPPARREPHLRAHVVACLDGQYASLITANNNPPPAVPAATAAAAGPQPAAAPAAIDWRFLGRLLHAHFRVVQTLGVTYPPAVV